jgi:hypothetical protein
VKELDLDALLGEMHPSASFHDAIIRTICIHYESRELWMGCTLPIGDPDAESKEAREATADGTLQFSGLLYCVLEPPDTNYAFEENGLEVSSNGSVATTKFKGPHPALPDISEEAAFVHWFFVSNWNAFLFIAATGARFVWK